MKKTLLLASLPLAFIPTTVIISCSSPSVNRNVIVKLDKQKFLQNLLPPEIDVSKRSLENTVYNMEKIKIMKENFSTNFKDYLENKSNSTIVPFLTITKDADNTDFNPISEISKIEFNIKEYNETISFDQNKPDSNTKRTLANIELEITFKKDIQFNKKKFDEYDENSGWCWGSYEAKKLTISLAAIRIKAPDKSEKENVVGALVNPVNIENKNDLGKILPSSITNLEEFKNKIKYRINPEMYNWKFKEGSFVNKTNKEDLANGSLRFDISLENKYYQMDLDQTSTELINKTELIIANFKKKPKDKN